MSHVSTAYACTDCYLMAHDPLCESPQTELEHADICYTDWTCEYGAPSIDGECREPGQPDSVCTACDGSGTEHGTTVGGTCDLGEHAISGYWEYHTYLA